MQHHRYQPVRNTHYKQEQYATYTSGFGIKPSSSNIQQDERRFTQRTSPSFSIRQSKDQTQPGRMQYDRVSNASNTNMKPSYIPQNGSYQYPSMMRNQSTPNVAMQLHSHASYARQVQQAKTVELTSKDYLIKNKNPIKTIPPELNLQSVSDSNTSQKFHSPKSVIKSEYDFDYKNHFTENKSDYSKVGKLQLTTPEQLTKFGTSQSVGIVLDTSMSDLKSVNTLFTYPNVDSPKQSKFVPTSLLKTVVQSAEFIKQQYPVTKVFNYNSPAIESPERKNNHQRQSINNRQFSLPYNLEPAKTNNPQNRQQSSSKTDVNGYISTVNDKNRKIGQLESKIMTLESSIIEKNEMIQKCHSLIVTQKQKQKQIIEKFNTQITKLRKEIELNDVKKHSLNSGMQDKFHKINLQNQQINANNNILQKQIALLKNQLNKKTQSDGINQQMYGKLKGMVVEKTNKAIQIQKLLDHAKQQNAALKNRISELVNANIESMSKVQVEDGDKNQMWNEIIKMNEEENMKYRNNVMVKDEEIHRLEEVNRQVRAYNDSLKNEIQIEKLKRVTDLKNSQTNYKIQEQLYVNQISTLQKLLKTIQQKLKTVIHEDKKKDDFMVTYLKNRVDVPEDKIRIQQFFQKYELLSVNPNIVDCLQREQKQIDSLKAEVKRLIQRK